jgi:hypothetical protein
MESRGIVMKGEAGCSILGEDGKQPLQEFLWRLRKHDLLRHNEKLTDDEERASDDRIVTRA